MAAETVEVAVVTGAASGFGRAIAEQLAVQGASVAMLDIDADLTTPEVAAANALAGVLASEPHVISHGVLDDAVAQQQDAVRAALAKVRERQPL